MDVIKSILIGPKFSKFNNFVLPIHKLGPPHLSNREKHPLICTLYLRKHEKEKRTI